ncbi:nadph-dependent fmn fad containing oxidoreductase [Seiridium cupressi]
MADERLATGEVLSVENRRVLVLYGSETGNSQDLAADLEDILERLRFRTDVLTMDDVRLRTLTQYSLVLFIISTTGQGDMPKNSRALWRKLLSRRLPATVFSNVKFTTFGLGDSSYRQFNWAARKLHKRLLQLGANEFYPRGEADERHDDGIDGGFLPWSISLRSHLISEFPLPEGLSPIPQDIQLPPKIFLERESVAAKMPDLFPEQRGKEFDRNGLDCKAARFSHVDAVNPRGQENELIEKRSHASGPASYVRLNEHTAADIKDYRGLNYLDRHNVLKDAAEKYQLADSAESFPVPHGDLLPIPDAWTATIAENDRLTPDDHWQDVRQLTIIVHPKSATGMPAAPVNMDHYSPRQSQVDDMSSPPSITSGPLGGQTEARKSSGKLKHSKKKQTEEEEEEEKEAEEEEEGLKSLFTAAGDSAVLYPKNFPEDVQTLIDLMGWNDVADERFKHFKERDDLFFAEHAPAGCYPLENSTLRQLLTNNYDITAIPKRSFFNTVRFFATDTMQSERLAEFALAKYSDEFYDYTSRPRRSILEILQDFSSVKVPYQFMPAVFPIIRGREYSIASAGPPANARRACQDTPIELLIAVVKYKTVLRKTRRGLCSRYVESLRPGTKVRISLKERGAPFANVETMRNSLLCIATGTGLAPIRAAFWERFMDKENGRNVLFFGARNKNADYFFKDEWPILGVDVHTAFSRDQKHKIYIQDVIRQEYKLICELIQCEATIMICGSSGKMPEAVRQAILDAMIKGELVKTVEGAIDYLEDNNQLWEEVW